MIKKILSLTIFFILLGEIIRVNLGGAIVLKPIDFCAVLLLTITLLLKFYNKKKIFNKKYIFYPTLIFIIVGLISLIINSINLKISEFIESFLYLIRWVCYVWVFFVVLELGKKDKNEIRRCLTLVGSLIVFLGYIQYFFYSDLRNLIYRGWDEHMHRMFSVFLDPNFAGAFFVLFFLYLIDSFFKKVKFFTGFISLLTLLAVFLTFSRSALIMLIVGFCTLMIMKKKFKMILYFFLAIITVLSISSKYFDIENINLFRRFSSEARIETAKNALEIFSKNPIIGVGFNSYRYAQIRYGFRKETEILSHADASPDSSLLFVLATTGAIGFAAYIFLWSRILRLTIRTSPLFFSSAVSLLINSFFINSLFYPFIMLWFWILLALSIKKYN